MSRIEEERRFFNERAHTWDEKVVHDGKKVQTIINHIGIKRGDSVLDVGCGTGVLTPDLFQKVKEEGSILAMDLSENMIAIAKEKYSYPNVYFQRGNVLADLKDKAFQHIICYSMFPHFEDKREAIHRLKKHLLPKGTLTIAHSNSREYINGMHKEQSGTIVEEDRLPSIKTLRDYGKEVGLRLGKTVDSSEYFILIFEN